MELKNSQLAARFTGRSAVLAPVEADEITGAVESAFGGEFFEEKIRCRQHLFGQLEAALRQTGPDGNSACV